MLIATTNELPGYAIEEVFGEVFGLTVRSRNIGARDHQLPSLAELVRGRPGRRRARGEARLRDGHDHRRHAAGLSLRGPGRRSLASAAPSALEEPGPECGGAIEAGRGAGGGGSAVEPDGATLDGYRGAPA